MRGLSVRRGGLTWQREVKGRRPGPRQKTDKAAALRAALVDTIAGRHKCPSDSAASRWVLSDYFASGWRADNAERSAMPVALHLGSLYEQLSRALLPLPARPYETLAGRVARLGALTAMQREADKTAAKLDKERQFNRKIAINADLRRLERELDALRR